ncbi:TRAP transporter substrate-binding protein [Halomonas sp. MCCC 1A11036]|uniref:TRAP transporter substrate-binding protein n=1 Tax=Billgrantia zhangzhouensis TaxID=2733481 RepID=A0ABS9AFH8_9GAMM|nr:TRAP transporter substrate-binding protein [Halomonas zhangzhouensis]MCE8020520.1 TRAP transporter substrate-binding protein [Halomonas zhangzhouensis]
MNNRKKCLVSAIAISISTTPVAAQQTYELQNVFGLQVPSIGPSPQIWADRVELMSDGRISVNVHGAGDFVPPFEVFEAVSMGALDMGFDWIGYWADRIPVANLVGSMPFGPDPETFLAWMFEGGGLEIIQKAYDPHNVKILPCHLVLSEAGGWFNKEINSVEDLQGLNMRIAGLGARAVAELGANTMMIPAGEVYVSLERGRIDAAEFSLPQLDIGLGLYEVADYYYFPGWHQPASWDSILINMDVWNGLDESDQEIMQEACHAHIAYNLHDQLNAQMDAIEKIEESGVEIRRFPDDVLDALREASEQVIRQQATRDEIFNEAYESIRAYQERLNRWQELQYLPLD